MPRKSALSQAPVMFFDLETTSADWFREIWNVGVILRTADGTVVDRCELIISDVDLAYANPYALDIGHFWERHPGHGGDPGDAEVVTAAQAAERIEHWTRRVDGQRPHVVGCVPNFDTEVSQHLLRRHNRLWDAHYHLLDVENMALGFLLGSGWFGAWEAFLDRVASLLPGGVVTREHRERLAAGEPILDGSRAELLRNTDQFDRADLPRLARVLGVAVGAGDGTVVDPAPYLHPGPEWDSSKLAAALGVTPAPPELRHTALGDADWAMRSYDAMMAVAPEAMRAAIPLPAAA